MTPQEIINEQVRTLEARKVHLEGMKMGIDSSLQKITAELAKLRAPIIPQKPTPTPLLGSWEEVQRMTRPENNPHPPGQIKGKPALP